MTLKFKGLKQFIRYKISYISKVRKCVTLLGRKTDGNNEICLGVRFALCIIKALRLARSEHCSGTVVIHFLLHSL